MYIVHLLNNKKRKLRGDTIPLNAKGKKILSAMKETYGDKEGEKVFYASINAGKIDGVKKTGQEKLRKIT